MLSSYSHVNNFVFNVYSCGIIGKIILLYPKEITAAISSSIYQQHHWSRLSSINKALGCKWIEKETTSLTFIGRLNTSSTPLCYSLSHNNISLFMSNTSRTPELYYNPMWQSFLEKPTVLQQIKISQLHGTRRISTVFTKAYPVPCVTFFNIISTARCLQLEPVPYIRNFRMRHSCWQGAHVKWLQQCLTTLWHTDCTVSKVVHTSHIHCRWNKNFVQT
jgi:hypothetical protein